MILEPEHEAEEVRSLTLEAEEEVGAGKNEIEASKSTRNRQKITCPEDRPEKNSWNWQVGKMHPPPDQLPQGQQDLQA